MNSTIDDMTLIGQFLEGNDSPLLNRNLIIQTNSEFVQLYARWEGVIATFRRVQSNQTISLRKDSIYFELIHELLIKRHFLPLNLSDQATLPLEQYRRHQIPADYNMNYTEAKLLWREWRFTWNERSTNRLRRGILLLSKDNWYPIQDIGFHQGLLVIRTLVGTLTVQPDERLIWLSQTQEGTRAKVGNPQAAPENATVMAQNVAAAGGRKVRISIPAAGAEDDTEDLITAQRPMPTMAPTATKEWLSPPVPLTTPEASQQQVARKQLASAVAATSRYQYCKPLAG